MGSTRVQPETVAPGNDLFDQNLEALRQAHPAMAVQLESVAIPETVERVSGRDGTPNYVIHADGSRRWFGGSSMPTISAAAMADLVEPGAGNVLLPAMASGLEVTQVAARLARHCAVFVHEPELLAIRLALSLHDLSEPIASGRAVLLSGNDLATALADFFTDHEGYEFPVRLLPTPGFDPAKIEAVRSTLESAGRAVAVRQSAAADRIAGELQRQREFTLGSAPRTVVLSVGARPDVMSFCRCLVQTLRGMRWHAAGCVPDSPAKCHTLARLAVVRDERPDLVLMVNSLPRRLGAFLNAHQPVAIWFLTDDAVQAALAEAPPRRVLTVASTTNQERQLLAGWLAEKQVMVLEAGADATSFMRLDATDPSVSRLRCDVAVLHDVADLRAEAGYVSAESHVRLFQTLVASAPTWAGDYEPHRAPSILVQAERRCDRPLKEDSIRTTFVGLIQHVIAPTVVARLTVERLIKAGLEVRVWGYNWALSIAHRGVLQGPIPPSEVRNAIYNAAGTVVCPYFTTRTAQTVLDALASGGRPVYRRPEAPIEAIHPQLAPVLRSLPSYVRAAEAASFVRRIVGGREENESLYAKARSAVMAEHTLAHRVEALRQRARTFFG